MVDFTHFALASPSSAVVEWRMTDWNHANDAARARLETLLDRLAPADFERRVGDWTVSAILCHLAFWDRRGALILRGWDEGLAPVSPDDHWYDSDVLNGALVPQWLAVPGSAAVELAREAAREVDAVIAALKPGTIEAIRAIDEEWRFRRSNHRMEHVEQLERL